MKPMGRLLSAATGTTIIIRTIALPMATGGRIISLTASSSALARGFTAFMAGADSTGEATTDAATMDAAMVLGAAEGFLAVASEAIEAAISAGSMAAVELASAAAVDSTATVAAGFTAAEAGFTAEAVRMEVAAAIGN